MKKSKYIKLVLISATLASCNRPNNDWNSDGGKKVYMRSDTTAPYSRAHHIAGAALWFYAFRPYGIFRNGNYQRAGYYSNAIRSSSNVGTNGFKGAVTRGGFGKGGYSVSS
jgi:hypothetical protein